MDTGGNQSSSEYNSELTLNRSRNLGLKKKCQEDSWTHNYSKKRRTQRMTLLRNDIIVSKKLFLSIVSCCPKKCYTTVHPACQKDYSLIFITRRVNFFKTSVYLPVCFQKTLSRNSDPTKKKLYGNLWEYFVAVNESKCLVCRNFLVELFQISINPRL